MTAQTPVFDTEYTVQVAIEEVLVSLEQAREEGNIRWYSSLVLRLNELRSLE